MNWISNRFVEEGPHRTRWISETRFELSGLMRILAVFMRSGLRRQTLQLRQNFKGFAERAWPPDVTRLQPHSPNVT